MDAVGRVQPPEGHLDPAAAREVLDLGVGELDGQASAAGRNDEWKFGFVGGRSPDSGEPQLPPLPNSTGSTPMADVEGTIATFTVDRIAYSPSPPIVFAVVDFDGGGRLPIELTDAKVEDLSMGDRVEMTFRRLYTADGIHNYFWKARPVLRSSNG